MTFCLVIEISGLQLLGTYEEDIFLFKLDFYYANDVAINIFVYMQLL